MSETRLPMRRPTMIKGLIPTLPERGHIKIGIKGEMVTSQRGNQFQPPQKLDHFRVTTLQRGKDGNFLPDEAFHAKYGPAPTEIPVRLLYDDPTLNYPTRYACFIGKSLWCSGDGESAIRMTETPQEMVNNDRRLVPRDVACTCPRQDPTYTARDKCKMNGNLSVLIDGMGGVGGVWKFRTTSYNSIVGMLSSMAFLRSITSGVLANIPLKLTIRPKQASNPVDGKPVTIYVVGLEFAGDIAGLQEIGHKIALERATTHVSITHIEDEARKLLSYVPSDAPLPGDNAGEIVEEFYPEQVEAEIAEVAPPRPTREQFEAPQAGSADVPAEPSDEEEETKPFYLINSDGEEVIIPTAEEACTSLAEWLSAAAVLKDPVAAGKALKGIWESNITFTQVLRQCDLAPAADALTKFYDEMLAAITAAWKKAEEAKRAPAHEEGEKKAAPKAATAPKPTEPSKTTPEPEKATDAPPAETVAAKPPGEIRQDITWRVEMPIKPDKSRNYPVLRDTLCNLAGICKNDAELDHLLQVNQDNLRVLAEAYESYSNLVTSIIAAQRDKLKERE